MFSIVILFEGWRKTLESESADALDVQLGKLICVRACRGLTREVEGDANEDIKTLKKRGANSEAGKKEKKK